MLSNLGLHIPDELPRDAQSKLVIKMSDSNRIGQAKKYMRWTRLYQCQCGTANNVGRHASKKRYMPWQNVKCSMFARVVSTHDERNVTSNAVSAYK